MEREDSITAGSWSLCSMLQSLMLPSCATKAFTFMTRAYIMYWHWPGTGLASPASPSTSIANDPIGRGSESEPQRRTREQLTTCRLSRVNRTSSTHPLCAYCKRHESQLIHTRTRKWVYVRIHESGLRKNTETSCTPISLHSGIFKADRV